MKLVLKITPQRSTQYSHMTVALALPELLTSPLRTLIRSVEPIKLAGHNYLLTTVEDANLDTKYLCAILARLGAISEAYEFFEQIADVPGPLMRPLDPLFTPFVPLEMAEARRYRGKTNETFTQVLINIAVFAGKFSEPFGERLRILDPLAGGGTALFLALAAGYDAFGIELERQDVETTAVFVRQYLEGEHIPFKEVDERGRRAGRRYQFEIGRKGNTRHLVLANGDSREALAHMREVAGGPHMHAIVGDLPYGIQHFAEIADLLGRALPVWEQMLVSGGTLALAWNATRIERLAMLDLFAQHTHLQVLNEPPYTQFAHAVDRVIKKRDIIIGVKI
jgi:hypothetical protein